MSGTWTFDLEDLDTSEPAHAAHWRGVYEELLRSCAAALDTVAAGEDRHSRLADQERWLRQRANYWRLRADSLEAG